MTALEPDRGQIEIFVDALFRHAGSNGCVSIRSFYETDSSKSFRISSAPLSGGLEFVVEVAEDDARRAANYPTPVVFCPPTAVFADKMHTAEDDIVLGLELGVECDQHPQAARERLEQILGPATVVVASGGQWTDPATGAAYPKLHLHWRLSKPAKEKAALAELKHARRLAAKLTGADATNVPINHPIRWPGGWHRKNEPVLCRIVSADPDREIDIGAALKALTAAAGNGHDDRPDVSSRPPRDPRTREQIIADIRANTAQGVSNDPKDYLLPLTEDELARALEVIPNEDLPWEDKDDKDKGRIVGWNTIGMAAWGATAPRGIGFESFDRWSSKARKYDAETTRSRWEHYFTSPPDKLGAGTICYYADMADPSWRTRARADETKAEEPPADEQSSKEEPQGGAEEQADEHQSSKEAPRQDPPRGPLQWHGDAPVQSPKWLVRNRLPETGAGLLVAQWGMLKTFCALDLSAHVILGWNWTGEPIYRQCGVLVFAPEGAGSIPMRLAALVEHKIKPKIDAPDLFTTKSPPRKVEHDRLPFAWTGTIPTLLGTGKDDPLPALLATTELAHKRFMERWGLPLGLIWIDTMATATGWSDENDNAEASRVMAVLRKLSEATGAVVMGVDHLGKNVEAGSRGASAKEANADFVLALLGNKDLAGRVSDARLALRKIREGPAGVEIPFAGKVVDMGKDEMGFPITSVVLDWNVSRSRASKKKKSNANQLLDDVLAQAITEYGKLVKRASGGEVQGVGYGHVLAAFKVAYKPNEALGDQAKRQAFRQALSRAQGQIETEAIDGVEYLFWADGPF